jgi:hypothetical protein
MFMTKSSTCMLASMQHVTHQHLSSTPLASEEQEKRKKKQVKHQQLSAST